MDLTGWLLRRAVPCAFVVTAIGGTGARLAVERTLRECGWKQALSPAEADLLVVCGPEHADMDEAIGRIWGQMPGPRARVRAESANAAVRLLDEARVDLLDLTRQRGDADERDRTAREQAESESDGDEGMPMPGGVPMADRGEDRDGLKLDQLHIALGPALPDWPAGLSLRLTLQGDVVQEAQTSIVGGSPTTVPFWSSPPSEAGSPPAQASFRAARALDSLQRLLAVSGWPTAVTGRRLRDALLEGGGPTGDVRREALRWLRRVRRSRMLRWSTDGLGRVTDRAPRALRGDTTDRWSRWLGTVEETLTDPHSPGVPADASWEQAAHAALELLPSLVVGQELAAARLIVASLDPDTEAVGAYAPERDA
ncbi:hypothetical protein A6A08_23870 [Nocardiopsis sp. TSRI0078]|uniref:hypothetical protein n=1 Tax=unclassified Nocardiopsis TaxID=2649073 RepID=UPI00093BA00A|nr:hypothetical protein [Nocardiopsis sp. TSRI0078]OKI20247.1 hypothetical protein A6A08_23870 [Nocardiopsis sp. TSRI0078]